MEYQVGSYTIVPEDYEDGSCSADVYLADTWLGSCAAVDRVALEARAVRLAMSHYKGAIDKPQDKV